MLQNVKFSAKCTVKIEFFHSWKILMISITLIQKVTFFIITVCSTIFFSGDDKYSVCVTQVDLSIYYPMMILHAILNFSTVFSLTATLPVPVELFLTQLMKWFPVISLVMR